MNLYRHRDSFERYLPTNDRRNCAKSNQLISELDAPTRPVQEVYLQIKFLLNEVGSGPF